MKAIEQQLDCWFQAVKTGDPDQVTRLYAADALLLGTLQGDVRIGHPRIRDYFANSFFPKRPVGRVVEQHPRLLDGIAVNSGIYAFEVDTEQGQRSSLEARFTFVYQRSGADWIIVEHHSSLKPS